MADGQMPWAILHPGRLTGERREQLRREFERLGAPGRAIILEEGMTVCRLDGTPLPPAQACPVVVRPTTLLGLAERVLLLGAGLVAGYLAWGCR